MLCLALVFVGKARVAQIETERIAEDEEQARYRTMTDGLTGLPNRAQFLECTARAFNRVAPTEISSNTVVRVCPDIFLVLPGGSLRRSTNGG